MHFLNGVQFACASYQSVWVRKGGGWSERGSHPQMRALVALRETHWGRGSEAVQNNGKFNGA